jgi:hypothetical protein
LGRRRGRKGNGKPMARRSVDLTCGCCASATPRQDDGHDKNGCG